MANLPQLKNRVKRFFSGSEVQRASTESVASEEELETESAPERSFSAFDPDDQERQAELLFETMEAFVQSDDPDEGVGRAMDVLENASRSGDFQMAQHVLGIFASHASKIRGGTTSLPIPPLVFAIPEDEASEPSVETEAVEDNLSGEDLLHWFREDIHLNEHHRHWHMVYNTSGIPSGPPTAPRFRVRMKSRQGEIFVYMHKQMLARYEVERVAAGLPATVPFSDFSMTLGEGYGPDDREPKLLGYAARVDDVTLSRTSQIDLENRRDSFRVFLQTGRIAGVDIPINPQTVGAALESNRALIKKAFNNFPEWRQASLMVRDLQLHNLGHGAIASSGGPGAGVMTNPHTSLQDPVFWRWHRMIDDLAEQYYSTLSFYDFSTSRIQLKLDPEDETSIALFNNAQAQSLDLGLEDRELLNERLFEIASLEFANGGTGVSELRTGPKEENFKYAGRFHGNTIQDRTFRRESLFCERFAIAVKVNSAAEASATARLFICPDEFLDLSRDRPTPQRRAIRAREHRFWIEIDRRPVDLKPGENILTFLADESSIVRKTRGKAVWPTSAITEEDFDDLHNDVAGDRDDYCDCGWPISLLLPRGTEAGMSFRIVAMVSDGAPSIGAGDCGSRSFCGTDFDGYPELDDINMGFPFDRPAGDGTLNLVRRSPNMAMRSFTIKHVPDLWNQLVGLT